jgi:hypothetical protein
MALVHDLAEAIVVITLQMNNKIKQANLFMHIYVYRGILHQTRVYQKRKSIKWKRYLQKSTMDDGLYLTDL